MKNDSIKITMNAFVEPTRTNVRVSSSLNYVKTVKFGGSFPNNFRIFPNRNIGRLRHSASELLNFQNCFHKCSRVELMDNKGNGVS